MSSPTGTKLTRTSAAATTNATRLKSTAGQLHSFVACNTSASAVFLKFYDKGSDVPVLSGGGADTPKVTIRIPANTSLQLTSLTWWFVNGIGFAITGAASDTDTTAVSAGDLLLTTEHS